jgi:serine/threonine protein kinase
LDHACADDPELRSDVEALLASDDEHGVEFLAAPVADLAAARFTDPTSSPASVEFLAGRRVGPYEILREIGHGGMGAVYLANRADGQFRKRVAIKLVKPYLGTEEILRRFRNERQVVADLEHPNIAQLLDGGATEDGLPYLVMEYVEGAPIDAWCDSSKLSVRERVKLFRSVCAAVQYAHDKQVIHRDIKPANILVTADGTPKLLDFGIAKVLNPDLTAQSIETTTIGPGPMTPQYASPEQVRGEKVGPACDIYALGMVLYHLLTGRLPYSVQSADLRQVARVICEQEPVKPSVTSGDSQLTGDLDNIVLKALRKEPERRYGSAAELSADLDRYLQDRPVQARRESLLYRGRKFLKRNRALITAGAVTGIIVWVLVAGVSRFAPSTVSTDSGKAPRPVSKGITPQKWETLRFEKIATLGDDAPGAGRFTDGFAPCCLNSRGDLVFVAGVSPGREGVFLLNKQAGLSPLPLALPGQPAPGGGTFERDVPGSTINDSGDVAFAYGLKPLNPPELKGFPKEGLYRYSHRDEKLSAVVIPGVTIAPGFGVFLSIGMRPHLNNAGDMVFPAVVRMTPGLSRSQDLGQAIFLMDRNSQVTKVVAPGDPAPGGGIFDFAQNPWINDRGDVAFGAHVAGEECINISESRYGCNESIYLKSVANGAVESIAHQGESAPLSVRYRFAWGPILNNRGDLVFMGDLMPPQGLRAARGIFLRSGGITVPIAVPGDIMPDGRKILTVNPGFTIDNYSLNNLGEVSFNASLENGESALYVYSQGLLHLLAGTRTVIPDVGTISSVGSFQVNGGILNDSGQILFWATLTDGRGVLLLVTPPPVAASSKV